MAEKGIDFSEYKSFIKGFCRCNCWRLTTFYRGKFKKFINGHQHFGKNNGRWKGGIITSESGYVLIYKPDHKFADKKGYVREHRLVMEKIEGRLLRPEEEVHHINGKKDDNRIENLMLFPNKAAHMRFHKILDLTGRICLLCGGKTYIRKSGRLEWRRYLDGFICMKCWNKKIRKKTTISNL